MFGCAWFTGNRSLGILYLPAGMYVDFPIGQEHPGSYTMNSAVPNDGIPISENRDLLPIRAKKA